MLSAPTDNFQGPFSNINNCLEHGFPFIYWRIAKLGSHFTAYSCVLRSSQKWCWCSTHATGLQWLAAEFLASRGVQLIVKMSEERKPENCSSSTVGCVFFFQNITWAQDLTEFSGLRSSILSTTQRGPKQVSWPLQGKRDKPTANLLIYKWAKVIFYLLCKASLYSYLDIGENKLLIHIPISSPNMHGVSAEHCAR